MVKPSSKTMNFHFCCIKNRHDEASSNYYSWHEFQGSLTEAGPLTPDYWYDKIYKFNTAIGDTSGDEWSVFLHQGSHFYVNDLSKHMAAFERDGTPHLARHYKALARGDEGVTIFVVFVPNKFNGQTIIIHSAMVSVEKYKAKFTELEKVACAYAVALPVSVDRLEEEWKHIFVHKADATDLPLAIPVMDSKPTFDIDEVAEYYNDKIKIQDYDVTTALHEESVSGGEAGSGYTCIVFEMHMASQLQTEYVNRTNIECFQSTSQHCHNITNTEYIGTRRVSSTLHMRNILITWERSISI